MKSLRVCWWSWVYWPDINELKYILELSEWLQTHMKCIVPSNLIVRKSRMVTSMSWAISPSRMSIFANGAEIPSRRASRYSWAVLYQVTATTSASLAIIEIRSLNDTAQAQTINIDHLYLENIRTTTRYTICQWAFKSPGLTLTIVWDVLIKMCRACRQPESRPLCLQSIYTVRWS